MKKNISFMLAVTFMSFTLFSCQKTSIQELTQEKSLPQLKPGNEEGVSGSFAMEEACAPTVVSLMAGQHHNAGTVTVTNDYTYVYVTYSTTGDWVLSQTHLYVGDCSLIPVNNAGNPRIGHFPYSGSHANLKNYTYRIPLSALPNGCGCIAAHAVVKKLNASGQVITTETAWGSGTPITPGGSWAMKFEYCIC